MSRKLAFIFLMFFAFVTAVACGGHAEDATQEIARPTNTQTATVRLSATFTAAPPALPPTDTVEPTFTLTLFPVWILHPPGSLLRAHIREYAGVRDEPNSIYRVVFWLDANEQVQLL